MTNYKSIHTQVDIHKEITDKIITLLDQVNINDYQPPFASLVAQGLPVNPTTQNHYQGINILSLWFNQQTKKYPSNQWATFKQWQDVGAQVRKGEKGSRIIFYKALLKSEENASGEQEEKEIPMLRQFTVFNASQVDGYEDEKAVTLPKSDKVNKIQLIEQFCRSTKADIRTNEDRAYYHRVNDFINMPDTSVFIDTPKISATENYYATLLHELTHWTGAKHRLNRPGISGEVRKQDYAFEELIAEIGSAFLCAKFNIHQTMPENHATYIKSWLNSLKNDKTYIFKASAQAAKAVDFLDVR